MPKFESALYDIIFSHTHKQVSCTKSLSQGISARLARAVQVAQLWPYQFLKKRTGGT